MVIRPSRADDAHAISRIYVQTWRDTYLSIVPYGYLLEMSTSRHEQAFYDEINHEQVDGFVAEGIRGVAGFITGGRERKDDAVFGGEIYALYVLKHFQRQGIGAKLVSALAGHLDRSGIHTLLVRVLKLNPYRRFYQKINGTLIRTERLPFAGEILEVEVYGWLDATLIN